MTPRYPNGGTRLAESQSLHAEYIGMQSEPGEVNHLSTRRKRKKFDCVSSGERKRKSLNLRSVKPAGVASGESWDSFGGGGSRPGKLQSQHIAEEFWKTPP